MFRCQIKPSLTWSVSGYANSRNDDKINAGSPTESGFGHKLVPNVFV